MAATRHDDPYGRAQTDPGFAAAVAAAHTGAWSVPDALWWERHPGDSAPSGTPSPLAALRELQRRAFSADGDAAGDAVVAAAVRALEEEIAAERLAVAEAIRAADAGEAGVPAEPGDAASAVVGPGAAHPDVTHPDAAEPTRGFARRPWLLSGGAVIAVALGVVLGSQFGDAVPVTGAAPTPSASPAPAVTLGVTSESPSTIFRREQTPKDIPVVSTGTVFQAESFRYLGAANWSDDDTEVGTAPYYAALSASHMVCLVAMPEAGGYVSTCALESGFPSMGLRLYWESSYVMHTGADGTGGSVEPVVGDFMLVWQLNGEISAEFRGRSTIGTRPGWEAGE